MSSQPAQNPLTTYPEYVRYTQTRFHAPDGEGGTLCKLAGRTHRAPIEAVRGFKPPCGNCFDLDALNDVDDPRED